MEILLSAVLGELTTRSINFFISKTYKPTMLDVEDSMQKALLQAQVIVDEAIGRHITNQALLQRLDMLRNAMHRGCYMLDRFRYQFHDEEYAKDQIVSHSLSLSRLNSLKRICCSNRKKLPLEQLHESLDNLSSVILDLKEMAVFLTSYRRLYSQPYSMHLQLSNCIFGCQTEIELVIKFLLGAQHHGSQELEVLPIVGPPKVGKSTLVAHVCRNERVRDHFSEIFFLRDHHDLTETFRERCVTKRQHHISNWNKDRGLLVVVDIVGDLNEAAWNMFYSSCKRHMPSSSKIIVTSGSDNILKFGTAQALSLKCPSDEAFWYFFKTVTFGSMDPERHPRHARLAMEIAKMLSGCLLFANAYACLLRDNFDIHFWRKVLAFLREHIHKHVSKFGVHPFSLVNKNVPLRLGRMAVPFEEFVRYSGHDCSSHEEVPKIRMLDVIYGSVKAHGKLEALVWSSQIPPYYSYAVTCEIRELRTRAAKRKRSI